MRFQETEQSYSYKPTLNHLVFSLSGLGCKKKSKPYPLFSHPLSFLVLQIGITSSTATARDLFAHKDLGKFTKFFSSKVNPTGVVMVKLTPVEDVFYRELRFIWNKRLCLSPLQFFFNLWMKSETVTSLKQAMEQYFSLVV